MIMSIPRAALALAVAAALTPVLAGEAAAASLGAGESPHQTFEGRLCDYADRSDGYGQRNEAGELRVYQLAYREADDRGLEQAVLYVHENAGSWLTKQNGGWAMGRRLGAVTIGCGVS